LLRERGEKEKSARLRHARKKPTVIVAELAAIFHPELFPAKKKPEYFFELPDN